ncbi:FtsX-like permease family protein [Rubrolithibacter danxiaensis]|uniref:FtsX-like permease family protein n=1 Tax=Rubrolithibacter danxiaensis TaxID=3390805 RepID=UPI003BF8FDAF
MFKNYLKIAWRNLNRSKIFSAINISGLSIGIATCLVIMLFVQNELSYDRYNKKADQIVRVVFKGSINGAPMKEANVMPPTAQTLKADYPEVLEATRLKTNDQPLVTYKDKTFREKAIAHADSNFFHVFTIPFIKGNPETALLEPNNIVITDEIAKKYFGNEDPVGKLLNFQTWNSVYKITGVIKKLPANSHFHFDFFASMSGITDAKSPSWMTSGYYTYLVLPKDYNYKKLEAKLPQVIEKYMGPQIKQAMGMSLSEFRKKGNDVGLFLQPLTDIHLHSDVNFDIERGSDARYVYIFSAIAVFILLIACINFMNLSTAGASKRAREVGVRKVLGSEKLQLVKQFLVESVLLTLIALFIGVCLVYLALPLFNRLSGKELDFSFIFHPLIIPGLLFFGLFVGILAGSYPAFFLSSFKPIAVLKGKLTAGKSSMGFRSGLVVFQFFISIVLIVGSAIVYKQLQYIQNKKLGYDKDQVLVLHESWRLGNNEEAFRQQLLQDSRVKNVTISGFLPAGNTYSNNNSVYTDNNPDQLIKTLKYQVDERYIPTLGMQMQAGRNFSAGFATDSGGVIINETAAKVYGWGKNALGHIITDWTNNQGQKKSYRIIGIVKDFNFQSLHERITPLMMVLGENSGAMVIKVKTGNTAPLIASIKEQWSRYSNEALFSYSFLDESFEAMYDTEGRLGQILGIFAALTIFIACLGLFGLVKFTAEQRTKEIGIRKVLGATVTNVVGMLSKDFLKLVLIANLIGWPVAWWVMDKWLQDFAYKIDISWWIFGIAGAIALLIALVTISFQAIKAALTNPVKSLRAE